MKYINFLSNLINRNFLILLIVNNIHLYAQSAKKIKNTNKPSQPQTSTIETVTQPNIKPFNYDKTYWGMSLAKVKDIYTDVTENNENGKIVLTRNSIIVNVPIKIRFIFDEDGLSLVNLTYKNNNDVLENSANFVKNENVSTILREALESKYGPATIKNPPKIASFGNHTWLLQDTKIELIEIRGPNNILLSAIIVYRKKIIEPGI